MAGREGSWGSVVGEALGLLPLGGRVFRERVGELADESRAGLTEALLEVKEQLNRELDERQGDANATAEPTAADGAGGGESAVAGAAPGVPARRSDGCT